MRIPGPAEVLRLAEQGYQAAERAIGLVPRVVGLLDQVDQLMHRVVTVAERAERLLARADGLVQRADGLLQRAGKAVDAADQLSGEATALLEPFRPALQRLEQIATRLADTTSPAEVDAVVQVVNMLPEVVVSLREDVLPILNTLDTVAPDVRELLVVSRELNEMLGAIPGLGRAKKRIEQEVEASIPPVPGADPGSDPGAPPARDRPPKT
jgi:ABC-type transporter Mla subunit MlaD